MSPLPARTNHFNLIRALAAIGVLGSHAYALTGQAEPSLGGQTLGFYCVAVFFSISGFLITKSWLRTPSVIAFVRHRCLRIYPGLWLAVAFTALVIGPWVTTFSVQRYFTSIQFWAYLAGNSSLLHVVHRLPGVFAESAQLSANGSLWTLPYELVCYAAILTFGALSRGHPRRFVFSLAGTLVVLLCVGFAASETTMRFPRWVERLAQLLPYFLTGALITSVPQRLRAGSPIFLLALAVATAIGHPGLLGLILPLTLTPLLIQLACLPSPLLQRYNRVGDYSYGIYLYAFPIQQLVALRVKGCQPWQDALYSFPFVLSMACLSWHFLERQALSLARRSRGEFPSRDTPQLPKTNFQPE